ncbi:MAG: hypothetical protein AAGH43_03795 [Pseudomonadota bacterium]
MKTIVYELNEVPKKLFDFFAEAKPASSFARLKTHSNLFTTSAADMGHLSPWVTWPTLHRGVSNVVHNIADIGEDLSDRDRELPPIWKMLAAQGISVGVFGSLQSYNMDQDLENYEFFVPDTFAAGPECFPKDLSAFQKFNLSMVEKSGKNVNARIAMSEAAEFLLRAPLLGLTGATTLRLAGQVMSERLNSDRLVRRRTSQAEIAFDFYFRQLEKTRPDISFFFTNHVASSLHRYWPTVFPKDYDEGKFDETWLSRWSGEIPHAVRVADVQLHRLMNFANKNQYRLLVLSSMGQDAVEEAEPVHSQILITDLNALMKYLGYDEGQWEPKLAMAPQVVAAVATDALLDERLQKLDDLRVNGTTLNYKVLKNVGVQFDIFCDNQDTVEVIDAGGQRIEASMVGLSNVPIQDKVSVTAYHTPEGILIDYNPAKSPTKSDDEWGSVSVLDVAPSLLQSFGIEKPAHMIGDNKLFMQESA